MWSGLFQHYCFLKFVASAILNAHENNNCQDVLDSEEDEDDQNTHKIRDPRADIEGDIQRRLLISQILMLSTYPEIVCWKS